MNSEFFLALEEIERDKGIPKDYMLERINQALLAAVRKDNPAVADGVVVEVDEVKKKIGIFIEKTVTEEPENELEITLEQARAIRAKAQIGDVIRFDVETKKFGRIAAQAAKQVIIQGIREAERGMIYEEFTSREHEVLSGVVHRIDPKNGNVYMKVASNGDMTEAVMLAGERVKGEVINEGDRMKVYVVEVRRSTRGPQILVSRTHPGLVKRLFELEVPEIFDGTVEIKSIAREAGSRTKIAVWSNDPEVDAIGACVGAKGARVDNVVAELGGEKNDIVNYSDDIEDFVAAALAPAEVYSATLLEDGRSCRVIVPDSQLSLAIGKEGKNARLAAKLTNCKIDIKPASQMMESGSIKIDLSKLDLSDDKVEEEAAEEE
ncbi:MAG: transcription termination/antitermination protein NusA [Oscillospiraceae bacterium]|nr:transcription termination/antitermination protein NusA [Oscillospiraceae bacterium]